MTSLLEQLPTGILAKQAAGAERRVRSEETLKYLHVVPLRLGNADNFVD